MTSITSQDVCQTLKEQSVGATATIIETSKLLPWLMVCSILSGLSLGLAILAVILSQISEREARLAQYDLQILRAKVEAAGIDTSDH